MVNTAESPQVCLSCGAAPEPDYAAPLCAACRDEASRRPFPAWLRIAAVLLLAIVLLAATRLGPQLRTAIGYERGLRAEGSRRYLEASGDYQLVYDRYPTIEVATRLIVTLHKAGLDARAVGVLRKYAGQRMDKTYADEINQVIREIQSRQAIRG